MGGGAEWRYPADVSDLGGAINKAIHTIPSSTDAEQSSMMIASSKWKAFVPNQDVFPWLPLAIEPNCWWSWGIFGVLVLVQEHVNENISFGSFSFRWRSAPGDHQDFTVPEYHINCLSRYQILRFGKVLQREEELTVHGQMRKLHTMYMSIRHVHTRKIQALKLLFTRVPQLAWGFRRCTRAKTNIRQGGRRSLSG